jgi:hypothetical protein
LLQFLLFFPGKEFIEETHIGSVRYKKKRPEAQGLIDINLCISDHKDGQK